MQAWKTPGGHRRIDAASADKFCSSHLGPFIDEPAEGVQDKSASAAPVVVIADDDAGSLEVLRYLVEQALPGASLAMAENGFQALGLIGKLQPDLVITDVQMPHMNGIEMLRHLASETAAKTRRLVVVTALSNESLRDFGPLPAGVPLFRKPLDHAAFIEALAPKPAQGSEGGVELQPRAEHKSP